MTSIDILISLYERDIAQLRREIESYASDADLWATREGITNSGGNLALHLVGNLNHFIGATLGSTGYVRDREAEFSTKGLSRSELASRIAATADVVRQTLVKLTDGDLAAEFPIQVFDRTDTTAWMLTHILAHFNYHLGQINYHRRFSAS